MLKTLSPSAPPIHTSILHTCPCMHNILPACLLLPAPQIWNLPPIAILYYPIIVDSTLYFHDILTLLLPPTNIKPLEGQKYYHHYIYY